MNDDTTNLTVAQNYYQDDWIRVLLRRGCPSGRLRTSPNKAVRRGYQGYCAITEQQKRQTSVQDPRVVSKGDETVAEWYQSRQKQARAAQSLDPVMRDEELVECRK
jgi:hypothetical protein